MEFCCASIGGSGLYRPEDFENGLLDTCDFHRLSFPCQDLRAKFGIAKLDIAADGPSAWIWVRTQDLRVICASIDCVHDAYTAAGLFLTKRIEKKLAPRLLWGAPVVAARGDAIVELLE